MVKKEKISHISGKLYYKIFLSGANKILENQALLNKINVFAIPDADTGNNLSHTIRTIIDTAQPSESFHKTAKEIANAALYGARGNSGVIFSEFLYAVSVETEGIDLLSIDNFIEVIHKSSNYIYKAVNNPVDGTILSVFKDWAEFLYSKKDEADDYTSLILESYEIANKSLLLTRTKNEVLNKANVVDAGAKGFVLFLEGIIEGFRKKSTKRQIIVSLNENIAKELPVSSHYSLYYRFCTETLIKGKNLSRTKILNQINDLGDSIVIAGSDKIKRIHIHTDMPHILFERLSKFGTLSYQKAEDMRLQKQVTENRKWNIALVTDSTSDIPSELEEFYQIHIVPLHIHFGENQYIDKVTIKPYQLFELVKNNKNTLSTSHPNESTFIGIYSQLTNYYDSIISIHITEKFSGTYQAAVKAANKVSNETGKKISVLDSKQVSGSLGLLTLRIAKSIEEGCNHDQIVSNFQNWTSNSKIFVSVRNLKTVLQGGQIQINQNIFSRTLKIKPIISFDNNGNSLLYSGAFSQKANMKKVIKHTQGFLKDKKLWNYQILHAEGEDTAMWFVDAMKEITGKEPLSVLNISPSMGLNSGKGSVAIAMLVE